MSSPPFLQRVADYIIEKNFNTEQLCVILPNRRAKLFLLRSLSNSLQKNFWAPEILSIEDLILQWTALRPLNQLELLIRLFRIHLRLETTQKQQFTDFMGSGMMMLQDFNDVDVALANPVELFSYLSEAKAISRWTPENTVLTENEKSYLKFYAQLQDYYREFTTELLHQGYCYPGLAMRKLAENFKAYPLPLPVRHFIIAGFNALTPAEETIFNSIHDGFDCHFLWDVDDFVLRKEQEAGRYFRKAAATFPSFDVKGCVTHDFETPKTIRIIGVPRWIGQAKIAAQILDELPPENQNPDATAWVLADENLLFPVLNSVPESMQDLNLTMGFPLRSAPVFVFFELIFQLAESSARLRKLMQTSAAILPLQEVVSVFEHQSVHLILGEEYGLLKPKISAWQQSFQSHFDRKQLLVTLTDFSENAQSAIRLILPEKTNSGGFLNQMNALIDLMLSRVGNEFLPPVSPSPSLEREFLTHFQLVFSNLSQLFSDNQIIKDAIGLHAVYNQLIKNETLPFYGEPLQGVQILGLLETRNLDFDQIIMLSVNEGVLPLKSSQTSFIPFDIRKDFGLTLPKDKEAVMAYHFYHVIQRASHINLIYNTESGDLGSSEKSRFIQQIQHELPLHYPNINIQEEILGVQASAIPLDKSLLVPKTEGIIGALLEKAKRGFSPTALQHYIQCPMKFYFSQVLRIGEKDLIGDEINQIQHGNIVHRVLEHACKPHLKKILLAEDFQSMKNALPELLTMAFSIDFPQGNITTGKNRLTFEVIKKKLEDQLSEELRQHQLMEGTEHVILGVEEQYSCKLSISVNGKSIEIMLIGKCDRIDQVGQIIRILDYKTGKVDKSSLKVDDFDELRTNFGKSKAFQLLMYAYFYFQSCKQTSILIQSGIVQVGKKEDNVLWVSPAGKSDLGGAEILKFESLIKNILTEILDDSIPFVQTTEVNNCKNCDFTAICLKY